MMHVVIAMKPVRARVLAMIDCDLDI